MDMEEAKTNEPSESVSSAAEETPAGESTVADLAPQSDAAVDSSEPVAESVAWLLGYAP